MQLYPTIGMPDVIRGRPPWAKMRDITGGKQNLQLARCSLVGRGQREMERVCFWRNIKRALRCLEDVIKHRASFQSFHITLCKTIAYLVTDLQDEVRIQNRLRGSYTAQRCAG
jgi:hypothetical protein